MAQRPDLAELRRRYLKAAWEAGHDPRAAKLAALLLREILSRVKKNEE